MSTISSSLSQPLKSAEPSTGVTNASKQSALSVQPVALKASLYSLKEKGVKSVTTAVKNASVIMEKGVKSVTTAVKNASVKDWAAVLFVVGVAAIPVSGFVAFIAISISLILCKQAAFDQEMENRGVVSSESARTMAHAIA